MSSKSSEGKSMSKIPQTESEQAGRLAGLGAGVLTGAALGTGLIPIPFVGTFAGALVGGTLGSEIGQRVGPALLTTIGHVVDTVNETLDTIARAVQPAPSGPSQPASIPITTSTDAASDGGDLLEKL